jgi:hypothetical protein
MISIGVTDMSPTPHHPVWWMFSAQLCSKDPSVARCRKVLTASPTSSALGGHDGLSNPERWRSEFDSDARVYRRFEQFVVCSPDDRNDFRIFDCFDAQAQFIRHRNAPEGGQFLTVISDHSDGRQDVCPFAFLGLENGLVAGGSKHTCFR